MPTPRIAAAPLATRSTGTEHAFPELCEAALVGIAASTTASGCAATSDVCYLPQPFGSRVIGFTFSTVQIILALGSAR